VTAARDGDDAGERVPARGVAHRVEPREARVQVGHLPRGEVLEDLVQRFVHFAGGGRAEVRRADRARMPGEPRREPAPERIGLRAAAHAAQREQYAAKVIVARRSQPGAEADELRRLVAERVAREPAVERFERGLRVHAERVVHAEDQAAQPLLGHMAIEAGA
jgi:hypothetical protein